ncbi:acyltransferase family protein [Litchfieldia salsa]|uniref:Peptidoglycan/LPS O-acetylase OafA/YrhL, contains acyltransferase and SGNH-hydrolase domains n=1 Tax=Litchfieldia salsa TaxID=930152 RepID=A0A1H0W801_9BACI|nr:acyltransferase [Litchfieldia salsa]SDP86545.1 Peptidoglycan/LPS O-acetylase OafA/YrhL, contains acyltransferase and SGNH-hydrolase domains [Litchfieldia salsa]
MNNKRFYELDSLRGIAAISVVFHHCLLAFSVFLLAHKHTAVENIFLNIFTYSPLHILWAGHEAVILFFILSGFVLALAFLKENKPTYLTYIIKRFCRIYLPYIITIFVSIALYSFLGQNDNKQLSYWFNDMWSSPVTFETLLHFLLMTGIDTHNINTVTWTLVLELRISIIFPFLMYFINRYSFTPLLTFGGLAWALIYLGTTYASWHINNGMIATFLAVFAQTVYYTIFFILGALLAKYLDVVIAFFKQTRKAYKYVLMTLCIILYTIEWNFPVLGQLKYAGNFVASKFIIDFFISVGVIILFVFVISTKELKTFLNKKSFLFLGKISYSLYLIHPIVLLVYVFFFQNLLPLYSIIIVVPLLSVLLSVVYYQYVELPSMTLGKKLTSIKLLKVKVKMEKSA